MMYSDPLAELPINNAKYIKECTELYLGKRGIEKIKDFERFVNVEVLWLNGNKLTKLDGLDNNFRIKNLYAQNNKITTLDGSLRHFKFIERLHLFNNQISNLDECLKILKLFGNISELDLFGNPVADEQNYRQRVIRELSPSLRVLDRHAVTNEERVAAQEGVQLALVDPTANRLPAEVLVGDFSPATVVLFNEIAATEQKRAQAATVNRDLAIADSESSAAKNSGNMPKPSFWNKAVDTEKHLNHWEVYLVCKSINAMPTDRVSRSDVDELLNDLELNMARALCDRDGVLSKCQEAETTPGSVENVNPMYLRSGLLSTLPESEWRLWTNEECNNRSRDCFKAAGDLHTRMNKLELEMAIKKSEAPESVKNLEDTKLQSHKMASTGYRLAKMTQNSMFSSRGESSRKSSLDVSDSGASSEIDSSSRQDAFVNFMQYRKPQETTSSKTTNQALEKYGLRSNKSTSPTKQVRTNYFML